MKKYILVLVCLFSLNVSSVFAQKGHKGGQKGFDGKGNVMWNFGVGLFSNKGDYFNHLSGGKVELPAFVTSLEFGIHDYVSIGPFLSVQHRSFSGAGYVDSRYSNDWTVRENWWHGGAKACFHFTPFLNDKARTHIPEELDLYAGVLAGMFVYDKYRYDNVHGYNWHGGSIVQPTAGLLAAGARYFFTDKFGAYAEWTPISSSDYHWITTGFVVNF